mmetsp:Transcript_13788/g.34716  ORF Transcript_13788/g.34716 Transcript_13788/m.34716 type:complete len:252 (+) Transcript_13788:3655-4410(+)
MWCSVQGADHPGRPRGPLRAAAMLLFHQREGHRRDQYDDGYRCSDGFPPHIGAELLRARSAGDQLGGTPEVHLELPGHLRLRPQVHPSWMCHGRRDRVHLEGDASRVPGGLDGCVCCGDVGCPPDGGVASEIGDGDTKGSKHHGSDVPGLLHRHRHVLHSRFPMLREPQRGEEPAAAPVHDLWGGGPRHSGRVRYPGTCGVHLRLWRFLHHSLCGDSATVSEGVVRCCSLQVHLLPVPPGVVVLGCRVPCP